ncbi:MAG: hypothetical protein JXO22_00925 [Phycisphaerae bacterium]|nr:hypothetical protein [Phycisphaerae bacterium]
MNVRAILCVFAGSLLLTGCASNAITGDENRHEQVYYGELGITGEDHEVEVLRGSDLRKLSIMGEGNHVYIQDGALVAKIEIVGEDNEVSCPADLGFEFTEIGEDNHVTRR